MTATTGGGLRATGEDKISLCGHHLII